jgi:hypothetical protein
VSFAHGRKARSAAFDRLRRLGRAHDRHFCQFNAVDGIGDRTREGVPSQAPSM